MSLLTKFQVPYHDPERGGVYVIGVDFGDGEYAATLAKLEGKVRLERWKVSNAADFTEFAVYGQKWLDGRVIDENIGKSFVVQNVQNGTIQNYTNFKRCPGPSAEQLYHAETLDGYTYGDLMSRAFGCLVHTILKENEVLSEPGRKEIYLFVGRPSSARWEAAELSYAELLAAGLRNYQDIRFHVLVASEAKAAMASEYYAQRKLGKGAEIQKQTIAIIDGGSSTFDCVVVRNGRLVCEYSRQIGAGKLDLNLLDILLFARETVRECAARLMPELLETLPGEVLDQPVTGSPYMIRAALRGAAFAEKNSENQPRLPIGLGKALTTLRGDKEIYFGPDGDNGDADISTSVNYYAHHIGEPPKKLFLDYKDALPIAAEQMSVLVEPSYTRDTYGGDVTREYLSFQSALTAFYQGARAAWERAGVTYPDRVIVTGGATLMPFVNDIMRRIFETEKRKIQISPPTGNRHFSVSRGVAYIGLVELYKEKIYREVCAECDQRVDGIQADLSAAILNAAITYQWRDCLSWARTWESDPACTTLNDLNLLPHPAPESPWTWDELIHAQVSQCLAERLLTDIQDSLRARTQTMFPDAEPFDFALNAKELSRVSCSVPVLKFGMDLFRADNILAVIRQMFAGVPVFNRNARLDQAAKGMIVENMTHNEAAFRASIRGQMPELNEQLRTVVETVQSSLRKKMEGYVSRIDDYFILEEFASQ